MKFEVNVNTTHYNNVKNAIMDNDMKITPEEYIRLGMLELNKDVMKLMKDVDTLNSDNYLHLVASRYGFTRMNNDKQIIVDIPVEDVPKLHAIQLFLFDNKLSLNEALEFIFDYTYSVYFEYTKPDILNQHDDFINELLDDPDLEFYIEEEVEEME
jgi:hypothetical protein